MSLGAAVEFLGRWSSKLYMRQESFLGHAGRRDEDDERRLTEDTARFSTLS